MSRVWLASLCCGIGLLGCRSSADEPAVGEAHTTTAVASAQTADTGETGAAPALSEPAKGGWSPPPTKRTASLVRPDDHEAGFVARDAVLMGTAVEILVVGDDEALANAGIDAALAEMDRVERLISSWKPDSQTSALNRSAGLAPVRLDDELLDLLQDAVALCDLTDGKFDVTFKGAGDLWDFRTSTPRVPSPQAVAAALDRVDCHRLHIDREAHTAFLERPGMAVGLGGIGKGYAVDRAVAVLHGMGLHDFVVNAGGDLFGSGRVHGRLWQVAVRHPRQPGAVLAVIPMANLAVATSGDYEQYFEEGGKRYHHILDPDTGYPATACQSVTITAPSAYLADALATGIFVLGPEAGLALAERLEDVEAAIVDAEGGLHRTSGLATPLAGETPAPPAAGP